MSVDEPGCPGGTPSGKQPPKVVFAPKVDLARADAADGFDIIIVEEPVPRWLRKKLKRLARRGKTVLLLRS